MQILGILWVLLTKSCLYYQYKVGPWSNTPYLVNKYHLRIGATYFQYSVPVYDNDVADCFAEFFDSKVKKLVQSVMIDQNVYNGARKLVTQDADFMTRDRLLTLSK